MTKQESDDTKIAVINNNIGFIQKDILEIKLSLKEQYATRESLVTITKETEIRLIRLEQQNSLYKWLNPIIATIVSSGVTFLFINYLQNLG